MCARVCDCMLVCLRVVCARSRAHLELSGAGVPALVALRSRFLAVTGLKQGTRLQERELRDGVWGKLSLSSTLELGPSTGGRQRPRGSPRRAATCCVRNFLRAVGTVSVAGREGKGVRWGVWSGVSRELAQAPRVRHCSKGGRAWSGVRASLLYTQDSRVSRLLLCV